MKIAWLFDTGFRYDDENRAPGWIVPMGSLLIATFTCIVFVEFGAPPGWPITLIAAVDTLITYTFIKARLVRVWKRGFRGVLRNGTWIEIAAACWVLWATAACFSGMTRLRPLQLAIWQQWMLNGSSLLTQYVPPVALGCTVIGFLLGLFQRRPFRGPAMHVTAFFFWSTVVIFGAIAVVPPNANWPMLVGEFAGILGVAVILAALVLAVMQKKAPDQTTTDERR